MQPSILEGLPVSPAPPLERAAVLGVVIQLSHAFLEQFPDGGAFEEWHSQLVLRVHKVLE